MCRRRATQLLRGLRQDGGSSLVPKRRGRRRNQRLLDAVRDPRLEVTIVGEHYRDFGLTWRRETASGRSKRTSSESLRNKTQSRLRQRTIDPGVILPLPLALSVIALALSVLHRNHERAPHNRAEVRPMRSERAQPRMGRCAGRRSRACRRCSLPQRSSPSPIPPGPPLHIHASLLREPASATSARRSSAVRAITVPRGIALVPPDESRLTVHR